MANVSGKTIVLTICILSSLSLVARSRKVAPSPTPKAPAKTVPAPTEQPKKSEPLAQAPIATQKSTVTIKNIVTCDMAAYQYCGTHAPEQFSIELNGFVVPLNEEKNIEITNNKLEVTYHYSFAKGLYAGSKTCVITVPENTKIASVNFSWHKEPRVWLEKSA